MRRSIVSLRVLLAISIIFISFGCFDVSRIPTEEKNLPELNEPQRYGTIEFVKTPVYGVVSRQIPVSLIGKFSRFKNDEYFEIRSDGTYTVNVLENDCYYDFDEHHCAGEQVYLKYTEKDLDLVSFFSDEKTCVLEFRAKLGCRDSFRYSQLSEEFWSWDTPWLDSERIMQFNGNEEAYKRVSSGYIRWGGAGKDVIEMEPFPPLEIVEKPEFSVVTNKLSKAIIGKYVANDELWPQRFFEINADGTFTVAIFDEDDRSYRVFTEKEMDLVVFNEKVNDCILEFRLKVGYEWPYGTEIAALSWSFNGRFDNLRKPSKVSWFTGYNSIRYKRTR